MTKVLTHKKLFLSDRPRNNGLANFHWPFSRTCRFFLSQKTELKKGKLYKTWINNWITFFFQITFWRNKGQYMSLKLREKKVINDVLNESLIFLIRQSEKIYLLLPQCKTSQSSSEKFLCFNIDLHPFRSTSFPFYPLSCIKLLSYLISSDPFRECIYKFRKKKKRPRIFSYHPFKVTTIYLALKGQKFFCGKRQKNCYQHLQYKIWNVLIAKKCSK